jgi:hypothetical protein
VDRGLDEAPIVDVDIVYWGHKMYWGFVFSKVFWKCMVFL